MENEQNTQENGTLIKAQLERIEKNRQKAITLRKSKLVAHSYSKSDIVTLEKSTIKIGGVRYKDTGGGFLLEEKVDEPESSVVPVAIKPSVFYPDQPTCDLCSKIFAKSWLFDTFDHRVCDECKDPEIHKLITKTEAQNEYLLKDCDLEKRDPSLKYVSKKNPHNVRWGEMKLYLQLQVEKRALEVWGSIETLQEELKKREEKRVFNKTKKYAKHIKELRMSMRSSLYDRTSASHEHKFGPESYNEEEDIYSHSCLTCDYQETYEKM